MFPQGNKTVKVAIQLYKDLDMKSLIGLVSRHSGKLTRRLHNSANFQQILTNDMRKSKLKLFPSKEI